MAKIDSKNSNSLADKIAAAQKAREAFRPVVTGAASSYWLPPLNEAVVCEYRGQNGDKRIKEYRFGVVENGAESEKVIKGCMTLTPVLKSVEAGSIVRLTYKGEVKDAGDRARPVYLVEVFDGQ